MLHPIPPRERRDVFLRDLFTLLLISKFILFMGNYLNKFDLDDYEVEQYMDSLNGDED